MFGRITRGAIIGGFGALGAMALHLDIKMVALILIVTILLAVVDVLAGEAFALVTVFGIGALIWAWTPLGSFVTEKFRPAIEEQLRAPPEKEAGVGSKEQPSNAHPK